jgi:hypothetical protein
MLNKFWLLRYSFRSALWPKSGDNDGCTDATLKGDYGFRITGQRLPPGGAPIQTDGVAITHFDGQGNLTQVDFLLTNGVPNPGPADPVTGFHIDETGTCKVHPDCTGSAVIYTLRLRVLAQGRRSTSCSS